MKKLYVNSMLMILAAGLILAVVARFSIQTAFAQNATISGRVSIGPFCPVQRINMTCGGPPNTYSSRSLILRPQLGVQIYIPLSSNGNFYAKVPAGFYYISITNCTFLGCSHVSPPNVSIQSSVTTVVNVSIDTGIR